MDGAGGYAVPFPQAESGIIKIRGGQADMNSMPERRSEVRMMCADLIEVCWRDFAGKTCRSQAVLEDISASGACLQLETSVPVGAVLRWHSPKKEFAGVVRYCVFREIGYFTGVQFDPASRWSKAGYYPQHLLDLERLVVRMQGPPRKTAPPSRNKTVKR